MQLTEAINQFQLQQKAQAKTPFTIRNYLIAIGCFARDLAQKLNYPPDVTDMTEKEIENYMYLQLDKGLKPSSRNAIACALKVFVKFCYDREWLPKDFSERIVKAKLPQTERNYLSAVEVEQVVGVISHPIVRFLVIFIFNTGLRISEAQKLTLADVDLLNGVIRVVEGKGKKDRTIPINQNLKTQIEAYLANERPESASNKFFATKSTGGLSSNFISKTLAKAKAELNWTRELTPHIFRHSFASHLVKNSVNIVHLQKLLGHNSLDTTSIYTHAKLDELKQSIEVFSK